MHNLIYPVSHKFMKKLLNSNLLLTILLVWAWVLLVGNAVRWITISTSSEADHVLRLYSLFLWNDDNSANISWSNNKLHINNWLVVWSGNNATGNAIIWWWERNEVSWNYWMIAWWSENSINWAKWVILWWQGNSAKASWFVLWWQGNSAEASWVVIGGSGNSAKSNEVAIWLLKISENSLAWNADDVSSWKARIWAQMLIWTWKTLTWVSLVVDGAVKVAWDANTGSNDNPWEIRFVGGCFYSYDGVAWSVMTTLTWWCTAISTKKSCNFGNVVLQHGDKAKAYIKSLVMWSKSCEVKDVYCYDGSLKQNAGDTQSYSPYCYEIK